MRICIGVMFVTVIATAALVWPGMAEVVSGLVVPRIPDLAGEGLGWTVALIGGVGGTFTVLCYGYWIREEGRTDPADLGTCRIDLGVGYLMTALFGVAMVIIGSTIELEGSGASLLVALSGRLSEPLGRVGSLLFLIGAAGAVFSSLLGVWQAVPYLFADVWQLVRPDARAGPGTRPAIDTRALPYRGFLVALAILPLPGLFLSFQSVQKAYALVGASFIPLLTLALLILNGRSDRVGAAYRNRPLTIAVLLAILAFFVWVMLQTLVD
jgi:Mn2+/Fe2+ NRAMP family transporter